MRLTFEQSNVVSSRERNLIVQAFAGTGKTSTLVEFARAHPKERMLYLAFNKAVQVEATAKFPPNVECRTTHSLAFSPFGATYRQKLRQPRVFEVAKALGHGVEPRHAKHALDAVMAWCCSADPVIDARHVRLSSSTLESQKETDYAREIAGLASKVWQRMRDVNDPLGMPHDGYLKLFQLSRPDLSRFSRILFDEAQDANPVTTAIVMSQPRCGVVMVGDAHQSIYQFRGAQNAMNCAPNWPRLTLTRSFRFGAGVAQVANALLTLKGERSLIVGAGQHGTEFGVDRTEPFTVIARTNAALIGAAVANPDARLAWVGGLENYPLERVLDAYSLMIGDRGAIRDVSLLAFDSFASMDLYAEATDDIETKMLVTLVKQYGSDLPALVDGIRKRSTDEAHAAIVLSTAHRAKGLEWRQVVLVDDYIDLLAEADRASKAGLSGPLTVKGADEVNVLYVAVTRALHRIQLPQALQAFLGPDLQNQPDVEAPRRPAELPVAANQPLETQQRRRRAW